MPAVGLSGPLGTRASGVAGPCCPAHQGVKDTVAVKMKHAGWEEDQGANLSTSKRPAEDKQNRHLHTGTPAPARRKQCPRPPAPQATLTVCLPLGRGLWGSQEPPPTDLQLPARHPTLHEAATGDCDARPHLSTAGRSKSQAAPGRAAGHGRPRTQLTGAPPDSLPRHTAAAKQEITPERQQSNDCQLAEPAKPEGDVGFHSKRPGLMDSTHFEVSERKNYQLVKSQQLMA